MKSFWFLVAVYALVALGFVLQLHRDRPELETHTKFGAAIIWPTFVGHLLAENLVRRDGGKR